MKRALITGDKGFVGRHFSRYLDARSWDVTGIDLVDGVDCIDFFRTDTSARPFDLVLHCAANVGGRQRIDNAPVWIARNLATDQAYFEWLSRARPRSAVYFSSSAVYPVQFQKQAGNVLQEYSAGYAGQSEPDAMYGWAKLTGELMAQHYTGNLTVVRPFSGYGTDQDICYPFPAFVRRAAGHIDPVPIWGDVDSTRDWIHIDDIVRATMALVESETCGPINLCTGRATSFLELAQMMAWAAGYSPEYSPRSDMPTGCFSRVGSTERLRRVYEPTISIEEGIDRAFYWVEAK